jgi:arylsulfatase
MHQTSPNILLLMTDQQRFDSLGCYGAGFAHTPNLDRLAADGALFEQCYANNPICTPSRASLMTGKHVPDHGVQRLNDCLPPEEVLFPERLREQGYQTSLFGKLHVSASDSESRIRHPHDGFDVYEWCNEGCMHMDAPHQAYAQWLKQGDPVFHARLQEEGRGLTHPPRDVHMTNWAVERTISFLEHERDPERPFFCMTSVFEPHNPYEHYPEEMGALVNPDLIPPPIGKGSGPEPEGIARERHENYFADFESISPDAIQEMRHGYHASVAYADLEFGRLLDRLDALGLRENTLVLFTSDHGDMLGDHDLLVKGAFFYDPCVRVPLLMRWPEGFAGAKRVSGLVQLHDVAATILAAAGTPRETIRNWMPDSENLLDLVQGRIDTVHDVAYCCYRNSGMGRDHQQWEPPINATMIRDDRYKLCVWNEASEGVLYDMDNDPEEQVNMWNMSVADKLKKSLQSQLERRFGDMGTS